MAKNKIPVALKQSEPLSVAGQLRESSYEIELGNHPVFLCNILDSLVEQAVIKVLLAHPE